MLAPSNLGGDCLSEEVGLFEATDGTAPEYAVRRTRDHVAQFTRLHDMIMSDNIDEADLAELENRDAIFQEVDYRIYG